MLMAKSAICPGIITLIWALITSNTTGDDDDEDPDDELLCHVNTQRKNVAHFSANANSNHLTNNSILDTKLAMTKNAKIMQKWHYNYLNGTKYELYRVPLKKKTF